MRITLLIAVLFFALFSLLNVARSAEERQPVVPTPPTDAVLIAPR